MGFIGWVSATASFRTGAAIVGMTCHLLSWGAFATGNFPVATALHYVGEAGMAMVVAPPGTNPLENAVTAPAAIVTGPV